MVVNGPCIGIQNLKHLKPPYTICSCKYNNINTLIQQSLKTLTLLWMYPYCGNHLEREHDSLIFAYIISMHIIVVQKSEAMIII